MPLSGLSKLTLVNEILKYAVQMIKADYTLVDQFIYLV